MAIEILSDLDKWREVAFTPGKKPDTYNLRPEAEAYVWPWPTVMIGMDVLDEKTAEEWLTRLRALEIVYGPRLRRFDEATEEWVPVPVTMDALRPYFGTRTNAFPAWTRAKFNRHMGKLLMDRAAERPKSD